MIKVLFESNTKLSDSLTYDITAWSLPYAFGLNALASAKSVGYSKVTHKESINQSDENAVGYLLEWKSLTDAKFLADLINHGIKVRFTEKPITTAGKSFERGTLIITRGDNSNLTDFDQQLLVIANTYDRQLTAANSGFFKRWT